MRTHQNYQGAFKDLGILIVKSQAKSIYTMNTMVYSQDTKKICIHDGVTKGGVFCFSTEAADFSVKAGANSGVIVTQNGQEFIVSLDLCAKVGAPLPITSAAKLLGCDAFGNLIAVPPYTNPAANTVPVALDDLFSTPKNVTLTGAVSGNDTDADGDALAYALIAPPSATAGSLTFNQNGTFSFVPANNFVGQTQWTYSVSDGNGGSDIATVTLNVTALANNLPVAVNDTFQTAFQTVVSGSVKLNDTDADGEAISGYIIVAQPAHGSVSLASSGTFSYTPANGWAGADTFTYKCYDSQGGVSNIATVTVTTAAQVNNNPIANPDIVFTPFNTAISILAANNDTDDGGIVSLTLVGTPTGGTATVSGTSINFTPATGFTGAASLSYYATDALGANSNTTTVTINVGAANATVTIINDEVYCRPYYEILNNPLGVSPWFGRPTATPVTFDPRGNDTSSNGNKIITNAVIASGVGSVAFTANSVTFTPAKVLTQRRVVDGASSPDEWDLVNAAGEQNSTITYTLSNGAGQTSTGTITVILGQASYDSFFEEYYGTSMNDGSTLV